MSPDGAWVASSGDLGLVVWTRDGHRSWSSDAWPAARRDEGVVALDRRTLVTFDGPVATARDASDGHALWTLRLAGTGRVEGAVAGADGTLVVRTDITGGRVFVIRAGRVVQNIARRADDAAISPDGRWLALTAGNELEAYAVGGGLLWTFAGDDALRSPRIAPDGGRVAVASEIGTLYVLDAAGRRAWTHDYGALPVAAWGPGGDLVVATWMGSVERRDARYAAAWSTRLAPLERDARAGLARPDDTPTVRVSGWGNAAATPAPLTPNLLRDAHARVAVAFTDKPDVELPRMALLMDGKADPPETAWMDWTTMANVDSGWNGDLALGVDSGATVMRITGVTFVEDPAHPESWLRDVRLQYRAPRGPAWIDGPYLLSNVATHTHWFDKPIEASRVRFVKASGGRWPAANFRLGELVFHGTVVPPAPAH